jgi:hypothetical protein
VIDEIRARLRAIMDRPIPDDQRRRAAVIALTIIVAGAMIMIVASPDDPDQSQPARTAAERPPATATAPAPPEPTEDPANLPVPSEEEPVATDERASLRTVRAAKRAAREFFADYLAYTYGRGAARSIANATDELRDQLAADKPRVPASERERRARLELLQTSGASAQRMGMLALVDDGKRRYTVHVELARIRDRWLATAVGA